MVKFAASPKLVPFPDWRQAVATGALLSTDVALKGDRPRVDGATLAAIPQLPFRAIAQDLQEMLTAMEVVPPQPALSCPVPADLPQALQQALRNSGIDALYSHQVEALQALRAGQDVSIVTPTASGKTLCFTPAIVESCLGDLPVTALYIFPLKALALDQMGKLRQLTANLPIKVGVMTGDTPQAERQKLFRPEPPHILAVSPDLLHHQLYKTGRSPANEPWRMLLQRLRWVVLDESHTYVGAFGAHVANLMRRLRLGVDRAGGQADRLQFICSSATIGNPAEMALRFAGREGTPERLRLIDHSGAGSAGRTILCLTPSHTANPDACRIVLAWLRQNLSGLVFCNSRAAVKSLMGLIQREFYRQGEGLLARQVAIFYGSLKGDRRRQILQQLRQGDLRVILTTSALEAGIDLPELDCCLVRGYPGSLMSFRQRIGRAGRQHPGLVMFLPVAQNVLDSFYGEAPQALLQGAVERAAFNPNYPTILSQHLLCSSVESGIPLRQVEQWFGSQAGAIAQSLLLQDQIYLTPNGDLRGRGYPHRQVNLRGSSQDSVDLVHQDSGDRFETMAVEQACREVFPGAVYVAQAEEGSLLPYRCTTLDLEQRRASLSPLEPESPLFTQAETDLIVELLDSLAEPLILPTAIPNGRLRLSLAWGNIIDCVTGYTLLERSEALTCVSRRCSNYHKPLRGTACIACRRPLKRAEISQTKEVITFEQPYRSQYQAPVIQVEINQSLVNALRARGQALKASLKSTSGDPLLEGDRPLWDFAPEFIALHSLGHQIIAAVPLVVLGSSHDVNWVVEPSGNRTVGYFFDTCSGGNGAAEAIFQQLPEFVAKAQQLTDACPCRSGCPRCLHQHGCPQQNAGLHKAVGRSLSELILAGDAAAKPSPPTPE